MKRVVLLGLLLISVLALYGGFRENGQAGTLGRREAAVVAEIQQLYKGADANDVRFGQWNTLAVPAKVPALQERQQEEASIEREMAITQTKKTNSDAQVADGERSLKAVETDFSNGVLVSQDAEMLRNLFRQKVDKYKQISEDAQQRLTQLKNRKQELLTFREPEPVEFTRLEIARGLLVYKKTVFYNPVQERVLSPNEIAGNPWANEILAQNPDKVSIRQVRNIVLAGGFFAILLILLSVWRTSKDFRRFPANVRSMNPKT